MAYVRIEIGDSLWVAESDTFSMDTIGRLLATDVRCQGGVKRIQWLLDDRYQDTSNNITFMEKENGNVLVGDLFDKDPYEHALEVPIPIMIDLLEQWDTICKKNPTEIIVTYQDGRFTVEGR